MIILGSGLAGLLAGVINREAEIKEPLAKRQSHQALLRFRSPDIGEAVGIPFKKVKVFKGIWHRDKPVALSPRYISLYSRKVSDHISYRSIQNLNTEERWISPYDFQEQLEFICKDRIEYEYNLNEHFFGAENTISTLPLNILSNMIGDPIVIGSSPKKIYVSRYIIPDCDVFMTYYYTHPSIGVYRASISGDVLIIESMWEITDHDKKAVLDSFGLTGMILKIDVENFIQKNGKIIPLNEEKRKEFICNATINHNIYSLGRFATWRSIVLDDVYKDIMIINKLINNDKYNMIKGFQ